jgi:hypothetical protein
MPHGAIFKRLTYLLIPKGRSELSRNRSLFHAHLTYSGHKPVGHARPWPLLWMGINLDGRIKVNCLLNK